MSFCSRLMPKRKPKRPKRTPKRIPRDSIPAQGIMVQQTIRYGNKVFMIAPGRLFDDVYAARENVREQFMAWAEKRNILKNFDEVKGETWVECAGKFAQLIKDDAKCHDEEVGTYIEVNELYSHIASGIILAVYQTQQLGEFTVPASTTL